MSIEARKEILSIIDFIRGKLESYLFHGLANINETERTELLEISLQLKAYEINHLSYSISRFVRLLESHSKERKEITKGYMQIISGVRIFERLLSIKTVSITLDGFQEKK